jgi:beta-galactosidase
MRDGNAVLFNKDWKFLLGDAEGAEREDYPDRTWKRLDLPHDWVVGEPFDRGGTDSYTSQNMQGFFAWKGIAWYRKNFFLPEEIIAGKAATFAGRGVSLYFGGAYRNSAVYINGQKAGGRAYGYSSFELDVSGLVRPGGNTVAVRLDNGSEDPDRWYSGAGLYRNVYLRIVPALHIKTWGVRVRTKIVDAQAEVTVDAAVVNRGKPALSDGLSGARVCIRITGPDHGIVAESSAPFHIAPDGETVIQQRLLIQNPLLWSADAPRLYRAFVWLEGKDGGCADGKTGEPVEVPFGVRSIEIACRKGMRVNGEPVKLKGVCLHHDCGILGAAYYDAAWRRRLLTLKSIGCNAVRTSHNPPAEEFLDLCDELGFYVIDECFDKWRSGYYAAHFEENWRRDLEALVMRDRNHPSVFMWSIGNEVEEQGAGTMPETQRTLASFVRALDDRPATCGLHPHIIPSSLIGAPIDRLVEVTKELAEDVDVLGLNYHEPLYEAYTAAIAKPIVGTECYEYYSGTAENYADMTTKNPWRYVLENDNVIGQFVWAGIDYLGESVWPAKGWTGAILDICGFLKPNAYYRKSVWSPEPVVHLSFYDAGGGPDYTRGRWSFPQTASHLNLDCRKCRAVKAAVYSNCDEVALKINGKNLGTRRPKDFENNIIEWTFEYEEGEAEVVGYRNGLAVCNHVLRTAGPARNIVLTPDTAVLEADCSAIAHVEITVTDEKGVLCPAGDHLIECTLRGDGEIIGACSPDLNGALGFRFSKTPVSGGRALVIIKAGASAGLLELAAYSEKLAPASFQWKVAESAGGDERFSARR